MELRVEITLVQPGAALFGGVMFACQQLCANRKSSRPELAPDQQLEHAFVCSDNFFRMITSLTGR